MDKLTKDQYETIATKLLKKGYTAETVYEALEKSNFKIKHEGEIYSIYASRVIAIMHSLEEVEALDLD
jgi:hypothetical protein